MMTTTKAAEAAGISYRQMDHWISRGYVRLADPHPGSGNGRHLSSAQFAILVRMSELVEAGVEPECAAKFAKALRRKGEIRVGRFTISERESA